jgi:tetratricopeptide (TPR) repeat protein
MGIEPVYRGILAVDIERFTRGEWTDPIRVRLRARLHQLLEHALSHAGVDPSQTHRSDTGDGVLLLAAAGVPTTRLLHPLVTAFAEQLARANRSVAANERLRMRLAVHAGEVIPDPYGHTGQSLNHVSRLLDAGAGRAILDAVPEADAVLLVSEQLYDGVVRHAYEGIDPAAYQPVWVSEKETSTRAWVHLPGMPSQPQLARLPGVPVAPSHGPPTQPTPRQLPKDISEFTGRQQELDRLVELAGTPSGAGSAAIVAIDGMGGVGKSAFAIHAAHQLADRFPDGQLYLELRGATPGLVPLPPIAALDRLLQSLGVAAGEVPTEVDAAAAYWRSLAAGRRLLVVLDNAATAAQVAPLLPAGAACAVLITSRRMLSALGVARVHLATLSAAEAVELLAKLTGPGRVAAESAAAAELAELCGFLPLALRLAGARAVRRPSWPLRALADRLVAARRLDELADEHLGVRASMQVSYRELHDSTLPRDQRAARAFRLLGILDTPDVSVVMAARLLDEPELQAEQALELLVDAQLLQTPSLSRYRLHDLLRLYAREQAAQLDPEPTRLAALGRILDCYLATARRTSQLVQPADQRRAGSSTDQAAALPLPDRAAAIGWLDAEQANLVALVRQAAELPDALAARAVDLVQALFWGMDTRARYRTQRVLGELALPVARRLDDHSGRGHLLTDLGGAQWRLGRFEAARACLEEALVVFEQLGDLHGQARTLNNLGALHSRQGRWEPAHGCYERALALHRQRGDRQSQAVVLSNLGSVAQDRGELEQAIGYHRQALTISREVGDGRGEAVALLNLGEASLRLGRLENAIGSCEQAARLARELDDHDTQGQALNTRGEAYRRAGDPARAVGDQQQAVAIARETGDQFSEAEALWRLGLALQDLRQPQPAATCWQQALSIFEALDAPQAEELRSLMSEP